MNGKILLRVDRNLVFKFPQFGSFSNCAVDGRSVLNPRSKVSAVIPLCSQTVKMGEESSSSSALLEEVKNTLEKALQLGDSHELRQLILPIENQLRRQNRRRIASFVFRLIALSTVLFGISFYTPLYYHLRAIGRIGLVQVTLIRDIQSGKASVIYF